MLQRPLTVTLVPYNDCIYGIRVCKFVIYQVTKGFQPYPAATTADPTRQSFPLIYIDFSAANEGPAVIVLSSRIANLSVARYSLDVTRIRHKVFFDSTALLSSGVSPRRSLKDGQSSSFLMAPFRISENTCQYMDVSATCVTKVLRKHNLVGKEYRMSSNPILYCIMSLSQQYL
jgi:hypothetical protein